jgi:hypothetical protein
MRSAVRRRRSERRKKAKVEILRRACPRRIACNHGTASSAIFSLRLLSGRAFVASVARRTGRQMLSNLEDEIGVERLRRAGRSVDLTAEGEIVYAETVRTLTKRTGLLKRFGEPHAAQWEASRVAFAARQ